MWTKLKIGVDVNVEWVSMSMRMFSNEDRCRPSVNAHRCPCRAAMISVTIGEAVDVQLRSLVLRPYSPTLWHATHNKIMKPTSTCMVIILRHSSCNIAT